MNLRNHMKAQRPALDKKKMFMFFSNRKVAGTSVNRGILKDRVFLYKENKKTYDRYFDNFPVEKAYKFTIVRNPFSRTASAFFYLRGLNIMFDKKFTTFLEQDFKKHGVSMHDHFHHMYPRAFFKGKVFVDYIAKLETIEEDWKVISKRIKCPSTLPRLNARKKYKYQLTKKHKDIISKVYAKDLKLFGYKIP